MCLHSDIHNYGKITAWKDSKMLHFSLIEFLVIDYALLPRAGDAEDGLTD